MADSIQLLANDGVAVVGICGGYQMFGEVVCDPHAVERSMDVDASMPGLGLLPISTTFERVKDTFVVEATVLGGSAWLGGLAGENLSGYEIHSGRSESPGPWLSIRRMGDCKSLADGACANNGRVWGCYLHGLFANDGFRHAWLASLGHAVAANSFAERQQASFDRLADTLHASLNRPLLERIVGQAFQPAVADTKETS